jgi:ligand-binding SRPBCC domain-containing protein
VATDLGQIRLETVVGAPVQRVFDLARDIDFHQRSMSHTSERAVSGRTSGLIGPGETVTWRARQFGMPVSLESRITEFEPPHRFVDEQVSGPFRRFRHEHRFERLGDGATLMIDEWEHDAPLGLLGRIVDVVFLERHMRNLLHTRNAALKMEAERPRGRVPS